MKKTTQKLQLNRQTLRALVRDDLQRVAGGIREDEPKICSNDKSGCGNNLSFACD